MRKILVSIFLAFFWTNLAAVDNQSTDHFPLSRSEIEKYIRFDFIDRHVSKTPPAVAKSVTSLTRYLIFPAKNNFEKVRAIYCWIVNNIEYDWGSYFSSKYANITPNFVLEKRRTICSGFAELFRRMGSLAGIETVKISGFGKGYGFSPGKRLSSPNHAWNAVKIDGKWYLIDASWGSFFSKENYFMPNPADFAITHYPVNKKWQLLRKPITKKQFLQLFVPENEEFQAEYSEFSKLMRILDRSIALLPESGVLKKEKAKLLLNNGKIEEAEPLLEESLTESAYDADFIVTITQMYIKKHQPEKAISVCLESLNEHSENEDILLALGRAYVEAGDYENAALQFQRILQTFPEDEEVLLELGDMYFERVKDCAKAEIYYRKLRELDSFSPEYLRKLGYALVCQGKKEEGLKLIEEANEF